MDLTSNFDRLRGPVADDEKPDIENYSSYGANRNVTFVMLDGNEQFLNYAYLVSCTFAPEENQITLTFTNSVVTVNGYNLRKLFTDFDMQLPKVIRARDKRYWVDMEPNIGVVTNINVFDQ